MTATRISSRVGTKTAPIADFDVKVLDESAANGAGRTNERPRPGSSSVAETGRSDTARVRGALKRNAATTRPSAPPPVGRPEKKPDEVDLAGMDSFPASDPPGFWTQDPTPRN